MSKNLKLFTDDASRQTYEQSQEYREPYVGGVSSTQTSSYNTRNIGKYFIDYTRTEHRLSDFDINKDIIEVEYLESTGTQWIDTGIYFDTTKHGYEVDGILINDVSGTVTICGTWEGTWDTNHINTAMCGNFNNGYFYTPPTNFRGGTRTGSLASLNVRNKVGFINHGVSNGTITITRTVNGVSTEVSMTNPYIGVAVDTFPIFGVKVKGTNSIAELAHFKLYGFKMFEHDTVILDLIPVRVGNSGYMYDKISGRLFGNSGTGEFILGPDVV